MRRAAVAAIPATRISSRRVMPTWSLPLRDHVRVHVRDHLQVHVSAPPPAGRRNPGQRESEGIRWYPRLPTHKPVRHIGTAAAHVHVRYGLLQVQMLFDWRPGARRPIFPRYFIYAYSIFVTQFCLSTSCAVHARSHSFESPSRRSLLVNMPGRKGIHRRKQSAPHRERNARNWMVLYCVHSEAEVFLNCHRE